MGSYLDRYCVQCKRSPRRASNELFCAGCRLQMLMELHKNGYLEALAPETPPPEPSSDPQSNEAQPAQDDAIRQLEGD